MPLKVHLTGRHSTLIKTLAVNQEEKDYLKHRKNFEAMFRVWLEEEVRQTLGIEKFSDLAHPVLKELGNSINKYIKDILIDIDTYYHNWRQHAAEDDYIHIDTTPYLAFLKMKVESYNRVKEMEI